MEEQWKPVKGFEGVYAISNPGRLKSFHKNPQGRIMSIKHRSGWYLTIRLIDGEHIVTARIHRLVAEHFIRKPTKREIVNHKDMNKQNNHVENLEWVTYRENVIHAIKNKPEMIAGMNNYNKYIRPKTIIQSTLNGEVVAMYFNSIEAQRKTGVCYRNILQVACKTEYKPGLIRSQAGGYKWDFLEKGAEHGT